MGLKKNEELSHIESVEPPSASNAHRQRAETSLLKEDVLDLQLRRASESDALVREGKTLQELLNHFDNDYTPLENLYRTIVGADLISDPFESAKHNIGINMSCSIIIPAYNAEKQLENALMAIQASSFNAKYPSQLEVIIVDDESPTLSMVDLVHRLKIEDLNIKVIRQTNGREGKARYSGALEASGDVIIFTDQDIVYTPTMIEEYMKRHQVLGDVACFGFRYDIDKNDQRLNHDEVAQGSLAKFDYAFNQDLRVAEDGMRDAMWLKNSGRGRAIPINTDADWSWDLPGMAFGMSLSAPRDVVLKVVGALDERYRGWGAEDANLAAELIGAGLFLIPNTGGMALHQAHVVRRNEDAADANEAVLRSNKASKPKRQDPRHPQRTDAVLLYEHRNSRKEERSPVGIDEGNAFSRAQVLMRMGLYERSLELFEDAEIEFGNEEWYLHDKAVALVAVGGSENVDVAIGLLRRAGQLYPGNVWVQIALADALATNRQYEESLSTYKKAFEMDPNNNALQFLTGDPKDRVKEIHEKTAKQYMSRGKYRSAIKRYNALISLAGEQGAEWSVFDKGVALYNLGHIPEAIIELKRSAELLITKTWAYSKLGIIYESINDISNARKYYYLALSEDAKNHEAQAGIERIK